MIIRKAVMRTPLRVLIVEDSPDDAVLLVRELRRGGYEPSYLCVDSAEAVIAALDGQTWDLILCDYTMSGFSGTQALSLVRGHSLDVPFIFVSGTIGEATAVAAMRAGAQDYVVKDNLTRLVPAIERELREAEIRRDHARAEAERQVAEARFREVLAMAPDAIVAVDEDQRIIIFNRAAETLFGYRTEEVSGQFLDLLLPSRLTAAYRRHLAEFAHSPESVRRMSERGEVVGRRKNGEEFPAEAAISKLVENGKTTLMAVVRDISERVRLLETLRQANELSDAVIQSSPLAIVGTDPERRVLVWNRRAEETFGYSAQEIIGQPNPSVSEHDSGRVEELVEALPAGESLHAIDIRQRRKDGAALDLRVSAAPLFDAAGKVRGIVKFVEDVTESKAIQRQLEHAQRMEAVGQLTGGLAHDFNNLLTVVIGNLDLLQDELESRPKAQELAHMALKASLRGAELTSQLLAFSRRQTLEAKVLDLNELVSGTTDLLRRTLGEQIEIQMTLADNLWPALADPTQLASALTNLAINARDAMPEGGCLTIETANKHLDRRYAAENTEIAPGDYVVLAVSDTGTGIPSDILDQVFEPFFTTKGPGKGTGLGLSMIYGFAKQSGGHVKIYSEVGHGTTVRLYLPRADAEHKQQDDDPAAEVEGAAHEATILVVEDDAEVRRVAVNQLMALGYRVIEAEDGKAALELLRQDPPIDLLFTDVVMPGGMSGPDLAREARKVRAALKVLLTSGYAEAALLGNAAGIGELGSLLSKPYRKNDLARKVREVLRPKDPVS